VASNINPGSFISLPPPLSTPSFHRYGTAHLESRSIFRCSNIPALDAKYGLLRCVLMRSLTRPPLVDKLRSHNRLRMTTIPVLPQQNVAHEHPPRVSLSCQRQQVPLKASSLTPKSCRLSTNSGKIPLYPRLWTNTVDFA
jgi:hypothetical protein